MKKLSILLVAALFIQAALVGCGKKDASIETKTETVAEMVSESAKEQQIETESETDVVAQSSNEIKIVYTNDIHSYIFNTKTDADGNKTDALRFSKVKGLVNELKNEGNNVLLVDAGDHIQGSVNGSVDKGKTVIDLMNEAGYDLAIPGNHEIDYTLDRFLELTEMAKFPYICATLYDAKTNELMFQPTKIFEVGGKKIAFVGIGCAETLAYCAKSNYVDEDGHERIYYSGQDGSEKFIEDVQKAIDSVRDEADYVIAIGHNGNGFETGARGISSLSVINETTGLDAYIDGHSHEIEKGDMIKDKDGNEVLLTQAGSYLGIVGVMSIDKDGHFSTELLTDVENADPVVKASEDKAKETIDDRMGTKVAELENTLCVNNPEDMNERLIRTREMNAGDFCTDALYWYFNEKLNQPCDIVLMNGGAIRNDIEKGDVAVLDLVNISPFENQLTLMRVMGDSIIKMLEYGAVGLGEIDPTTNKPVENSELCHVAGLEYTIDTTVPSSVKKDNNGTFISCDGPARIKDVKVYNRETGEYEPLDPNMPYVIGGSSYMLKGTNTAENIFMDNQKVLDYIGQDTECIAFYAMSFDKIGEYPLINSKNSPLAKYKGYMLDYENPYGAGRIKMIMK